MYHEVQNQTHSSMHTQGLLLTHSERQRSSLKKKNNQLSDAHFYTFKILSVMML